MNPDLDPSSPAASELPLSAGARFWRRPALYPDVYVWYVLFSALDIMMTWIILHLDGVELNVLADWVIELGGLPAMVFYKFVLVMLVVAICEVVGRRRERLGRRLAKWSVAITVIPVAVAFAQLISEVWH